MAKLTVKEAKFVKEVVSGKSNTQAALIATGATSVNSAKTLGHRLSTRVNVQEALQKEMERQGITTELIIKPIKDGLLAEKVTIVGNGDSAMAEITPDHQIRLKASSMAQTLIGANKNKDGDTINNFGQMIMAQRDKYND